ncbi:cell division cycle-associated protein 3 [Nothoprocta perdicaria]|uniref:cell division cycle-associated protein 3 n=1 Tax=Nothoprocta perdicaria TaxID=30464 RepID=UPI000E1BD059|nr:cell division cycle-associated protein 3 [Nothoprocta perdicaria]
MQMYNPPSDSCKEEGRNPGREAVPAVGIRTGSPLRTLFTSSLEQQALPACFPREALADRPDSSWHQAAFPWGRGCRSWPAGPSGGREARVGVTGSKPARRKTSSKIMVTSGGTGRSPLSILQDDNSPSALAPRQGKRHVLGENLGDRKEVTVDLSRNLKSGSCTWSDLNKENQQCSFVEN